MSASTKTWSWNERLKRRITLRRWEAGKKRKYLCQGQKRNICVGTKAILKKLDIIKYTRILLICLATVRPANTERKWMYGCLCLQCWLWQCLKCFQCLQWGMIKRKTCQWCRLWRWQSKARQVRDRPPTRPSLCKFQFLWQICQNITSSTKFGREDKIFSSTDESNVSFCRQSWITIIYFLRFVQFSEKLGRGGGVKKNWTGKFCYNTTKHYFFLELSNSACIFPKCMGPKVLVLRCIRLACLLNVYFNSCYWFLLQIIFLTCFYLVSTADYFYLFLLVSSADHYLLPVFNSFSCRSIFVTCVFIGFSCRSLHPPE